MKSKIRAIIFDLDGTLVDTEPSAVQVVMRVLTRWGHAPTREDASYATGRTWASSFEYLFKKYPPPLAAAQAAEEVMQEYRRELESALIEVPGSRDFVKALASTGLPLALVSGSARSEIEFCLRGLGVRDLFKVVLGSEDYPKSKPAADGFLLAIKMLGVPPQQTLIFEDSNAGIASAKAAGASVVAITGTNHFAQDLSRADHAIVDFRGLGVDWISAFVPKV